MTKSFVDLLRSRRSIRKYAAEPLDPEMVVQLMEAALLAPSSKGKRPCEFILVDDKQKLAALSECKNFGAAMLREASLELWCADAWMCRMFGLKTPRWRPPHCSIRPKHSAWGLAGCKCANADLMMTRRQPWW